MTSKSIEQLLEKSTELAQVNAKNRQLYETLISHQAFLESFSDKMAVFGNLNTYKKELEEEKSKNAQLVSELEEQRSKNDEERLEIKCLHSQIYDLQEKFRGVTLQLEAERQDKNALRKEYDQLIQKHDTLQSQMEDMEYDVRSCRDKLSYVSDLKNQLQDSNKFVQDLQEENIILRKKIDKNSIIQTTQNQNQPVENQSSLRIQDFQESHNFYDDPEKPIPVSNSPQKLEFSSQGLNARVVRDGPAGVTPRKYISTPKNPILRMNTSRAHDSIHSWIEMEEAHINSEAPTFLLEEAEKAKLTLAEFTNYIHDLEIS